MLNLLVHAGGRSATREQVKQAPTPEASGRWQPIPHHRLLELVEDTLQESELQVVNQAHALARDGQRYFGLMELRNGTEAPDYSLVVGLRNSHDQSYPAGLVAGSGVLVCDNLAFSGEIKLARRHTRFIMRDLPQLVERAVGQLGDMRQSQAERIDAYRQTQLQDRDAHHLLVKAIGSKVLPPTRLPLALEEWRQPRHPEFTEDGKSGWRLFNAVTEAIKGRNLDQLPRRTQALHGLLDLACSVRSGVGYSGPQN